MKNFHRILIAVFVSCIPCFLHAADTAQPNIVFILADDMGYGDPRCFNPQSLCKTPHIDRLASRGLRFTDAHAAGSVCVPSRYGLLTGRYPFRCATLDPAKAALIEPRRLTIASLLRDQPIPTVCATQATADRDAIQGNPSGTPA